DEALVHEIAKKFPACRRLVTADPESRGDAIDGGRRRHGPSYARESAAIPWDGPLRVLRENGQRVSRSDEKAASEDHIAIAVTVARRAEIRGIRPRHQVHQLGGMSLVRVGMMAAEILERTTVDDRARRSAETFFEQKFGIRTGHRVHRVEAHPKFRSE